jgi:hypothetical protein
MARGRAGHPNKWRRMEVHMDLSEFAQPYLKVPDIPANGSLRKVIAGSERSKNFNQLDLIFTDHTRFSLNKTNLSTIMKATGITDSAQLAGLEIELYVGPLPDGNSGAKKDGICVRVPTRSAKVGSSTPGLAAVKPLSTSPTPKKPDGDGYNDPLPAAFNK